MRIVAGKYGGRKLKVPHNNAIRPTSDKVRGAIFNALQSRGAVEGARVLDCFCGTGALGLESLSRGADHVTFWDNDQRSLALAKSNAQDLDVMGQCTFQIRDSTHLNEVNFDQKYTLTFLDPPYRKNNISIVLQQLIDFDFLVDGALCVLEMEQDHAPKFSDAYVVQFDKVYSDSRVMIVSHNVG